MTTINLRDYHIKMACIYRTYGSFTMETILATAFGRVMDIQRGESDELTSAVDSLFIGVQEGQLMNASILITILSEQIKR